MRSDAGRVVGALGQSANLDTTSTPSEMSSIILPLEVSQLTQPCVRDSLIGRRGGAKWFVFKGKKKPRAYV